MLSSVSAPKESLPTASLLERMLAAWSRSFELLAESKTRFPLDM